MTLFIGQEVDATHYKSFSTCIFKITNKSNPTIQILLLSLKKKEKENRCITHVHSQVYRMVIAVAVLSSHEASSWLPASLSVSL